MSLEHSLLYLPRIEQKAFDVEFARAGSKDAILKESLHGSVSQRSQCQGKLYTESLGCYSFHLRLSH